MSTHIPTNRPDERRTAGADATRERILHAAREVVARKGKRAATTREIAEVAGVNETTLFRHFGTKEKLLFELVEYCCPSTSIDEFTVSLRGSVESDLLTIGCFLMERLWNMRDMLRWSLVEDDYEANVYGSATWRPQNAVREALVAFMASRVERGELVGNPEDLAAVFGSMIFAHVMGRQKYPGVRFYADQEYGLRTYIHIFLNGSRSR